MSTKRRTISTRAPSVNSFLSIQAFTCGFHILGISHVELLLDELHSSLTTEADAPKTIDELSDCCGVGLRDEVTDKLLV